jgi:hypothetical protein
MQQAICFLRLESREKEQIPPHPPPPPPPPPPPKAEQVVFVVDLKARDGICL